ncbi:General secretion pathway protein L [Candidatus Rhodobacter oscarellae]|uniref:General secretion pathway protein L n=2 Tax=Candidatus Rhodobacter oscarellae TaxID=1675527 RepID=A0A0J9ECJ6_9RHOB|nr:General secretion pathway protein L [Candidatus Rhodobacter lobularis]
MRRLGAGQAPGGAYVGLLPGTLSPILPVELPAKLSGGAREQVAGRQVSDMVSLPAGSFEIHPLQPKGAKTWNRVLFMARDDIAAWRQKATKGCQAILPDFFALPSAPGLWAIEVEGDTLRARLAADDGFTAEADLAIAQLQATDAPKGVLRLGDPNTAVDAYLAGLGVPIHTDPAALKKAGLAPLRWADVTAGLNLLTPPSAAPQRIQAGLRRWRLGALAAASAAALWLGMLYLQTQTAQQEAAQNRDLTLAMVRQHFVPDGPILDVRAQVGAVLASAVEPEVIEVQGLPALTQFQIAAEVLTRDTAQVALVTYRPETGLETTIETPDFAALDALVLDLQGADFLVEQLDSRAEQSGGVSARLRLELLE